MKLSINMTPKNWGPVNKKLLHKWSPKTILIREPTREVVQDCLLLCPESLLVLDLPKSQVNTRTFAEQSGNYHAKFWTSALEYWDLGQNLDRIIFCGMPWTEDSEVSKPSSVVKYVKNLTATALLTYPSMRIGIRNMNPLGSEPWDSFFDFFQTYLHAESRHFLILEDYWSSDRPKLFSKHIFRLEELVPIIISDTGILNGDSNWIEAKITPAEYVRRMWEYERSLDSDARIHSACLTALDGPTPGEFVGDLLPSLGRNTSFSTFSDVHWVDKSSSSSSNLTALAQSNVVLYPDIGSPLIISMWDNGIAPIGCPAFTYREGRIVTAQQGMDLRSGQTYTFTLNELGDSSVKYHRN